MSSPMIFSATLTALDQPSQPIMISAQRLVLDFVIAVTLAAATVEWYLEFTDDDPNDASTRWFRETAEEDAGGGAVLIPEVVRTFADNGGATLAIGTHNLNVQFVRSHKFARVQISESGGAAAVAVTIYSQFGQVPVSGP